MGEEGEVVGSFKSAEKKPFDFFTFCLGLLLGVFVCVMLLPFFVSPVPQQDNSEELGEIYTVQAQLVKVNSDLNQVMINQEAIFSRSVFVNCFQVIDRNGVTDVLPLVFANGAEQNISFSDGRSFPARVFNSIVCPDFSGLSGSD